jgi:hypothetical protein
VADQDHGPRSGRSRFVTNRFHHAFPPIRE